MVCAGCGRAAPPPGTACPWCGTVAWAPPTAPAGPAWSGHVGLPPYPTVGVDRPVEDRPTRRARLRRERDEESVTGLRRAVGVMLALAVLLQLASLFPAYFDGGLALREMRGSVLVIVGHSLLLVVVGAAVSAARSRAALASAAAAATATGVLAAASVVGNVAESFGYDAIGWGWLLLVTGVLCSLSAGVVAAVLLSRCGTRLAATRQGLLTGVAVLVSLAVLIVGDASSRFDYRFTPPGGTTEEIAGHGVFQSPAWFIVGQAAAWVAVAVLAVLAAWLLPRRAAGWALVTLGVASVVSSLVVPIVLWGVEQPNGAYDYGTFEATPRPEFLWTVLAAALLLVAGVVEVLRDEPEAGADLA